MNTFWSVPRVLVLLSLLTLASSAAAAQKLGFTSPNGGEVYVIGQTQYVRINGRFKSVQIELSTDGGNTFAPLGTIDSTAKPGQNALKYAVSGPSSTTCVIRATTVIGKNTLTAVSGMFSIVTEPGGSAVISNQIALPDGAVTNPKLAPKAVTFDKIDSGPASSGMVLTADGLGNASFAPLSSTATDKAVSFTGPLAGDITGTQQATVVSKLQGIPLMANAPADNQVLRFNAGGNRWEPGTIQNNVGTITSIQGTPNQVNVANNNGAVTLSTPQNIAQGSTPSFAGLSLAANSGSPLLNANNTGSGLAANFSSPNPTTVTIDGGDGPVLDVTGRTGDAMHALTLGQSTSGLYAESRAVDSFGVYAISFAGQGHGRGIMARAYTRDGYGLEAHNASTDSGSGGGLLVDQDGTTNNIAVFQSNKVNRAVIDNSGTGQFVRLKSGNAMISSGTGSPNGAVTGNVGDLFLRTDGGAGSTLWVKEIGNGTNTGWSAK